jgi:hypothetical protein
MPSAGSTIVTFQRYFSKYKKISKKDKKRGDEFSSTSSSDRFLNYGILGNF